MLKTTVAQLLALLWVSNTLLSDPIELLECEVSYCQLLDTSVLRLGDQLGACLSFWKYGKMAVDCQPQHHQGSSIPMKAATANKITTSKKDNMDGTLALHVRLKLR